MRLRRGALVCFSGVLLLSSGCCGGGSDNTCRATLSYKGGTNPGAGDNKSEARQGACWKYCIDRDPDVDSAYQKWLASGNKPKAGSKTATLDDVPALKAARLACEGRCQSDIASGKATITFMNCR